MPYPSWQVDFAPGVASSAVPTAGQWVTISSYARRLGADTGRKDEWAQPDAGVLQLELDNSTGRFDPDNTSGPYYGQLLPLVWFRVKGGTTSADQDVFYGQVSIEGWRLAASQFPNSVVLVDVVDMIEQAANTDLPGSVYEVEVRADSPVAWWRLGESGSTAADFMGAYPGVHENSPESVAGLVANDGNGARFYKHVADHRSAFNTPVTSYPFTITGWIKTAEDRTLGKRVVYQREEGVGGLAVSVPPTAWTALYGTVAGGLAFFVGASGVQQRMVTSTVTVDDDLPHHFAAVATNATTLTIYVDGVDRTAATSLVGSPSVAGSILYVGNQQDLVGGDFGFDGTIDDVSVFASALSAARVAVHHAAGATPWQSELTSARVTHLLDSVAFPATLRSLSTGVSTMQAATLGGDLLSGLTDAAQAERGEMYADHRDGGKLRFRSRHDRYTATASTTSQATFGDSGSEVPYSAIDIQDDRIVNRARVSRANGSVAEVTDSASKTQYQWRSHSESGLLYETDRESASRAALVVSEKKSRRRRVRSITLEPRKSTHGAWAQVFARKIGDRITVKWRPSYGGTYTFVCWIEGIKHEWDQGRQGIRTTFFLSPVPYSGSGTAYWLLGTSVLGTDTRLGY